MINSPPKSETIIDFENLDVSQLITEDDTPVDNFPSEKQQRFLTTVLYSAKPEEIFIAAANVGIFHTYKQPAIVPDIFVSFGVEIAENWWEKANRSYFIWEFGKPPEVVIEIVSNTEGNELDRKFDIYQQMRVSYYVIYDPSHQLSQQTLRIFEIKGTRYFETSETWLEQVQLGLTLWRGNFENREDTWLRWCDQEGNLLLTGDEKAQQERQRAEQEHQRAEQERQRAEQEHQRAEQERQRAEQEHQRAEQAESKIKELEAKLRALENLSS